MDETVLGTVWGYVPALMDIFGDVIVTLAWLVTRVFTLPESSFEEAAYDRKFSYNQFYCLAGKQSELRHCYLIELCWTMVYWYLNKNTSILCVEGVVEHLFILDSNPQF